MHTVSLLDEVCSGRGSNKELYSCSLETHTSLLGSFCMLSSLHTLHVVACIIHVVATLIVITDGDQGATTCSVYVHT